MAREMDAARAGRAREGRPEMRDKCRETGWEGKRSCPARASRDTLAKFSPPRWTISRRRLRPPCAWQRAHLSRDALIVTEPGEGGLV